MSNMKLREEHQRRLEILNQRFALELEALRLKGEIPADIDPPHEADALVALSDGIGLGYVLRPKTYPPEKLWAIVEGYLRCRFGVGKTWSRPR